MFDPKAELANSHNHFNPFDPSGHINDGYGSWGATNFGAKPRKTAQNYENYRNFNGGGLEFRADDMEDDSGVLSPPLWKTSPSRSSQLNNRNNHNNYRYLSPNSRHQAIARGQRELMDMVKNMPESSYELSLKDLVEQNRVGNEEECLVGEKIWGSESFNQRVGVKRQESKRKEKKVKIGGMENKGLFLKMVFPISLGSSKKKKNLGTKVSPKPEANNSEKSAKGVDKEWWKKRFSGSGGSDSSGISSNSGRSGSSGSSGSSNSSRRSNSSRKDFVLLPGCWSFFHWKKNKHAE